MENAPWLTMFTTRTKRRDIKKFSEDMQVLLGHGGTTGAAQGLSQWEISIDAPHIFRSVPQGSKWPTLTRLHQLLEALPNPISPDHRFKFSKSDPVVQCIRHESEKLNYLMDLARSTLEEAIEVIEGKALTFRRLEESIERIGQHCVPQLWQQSGGPMQSLGSLHLQYSRSLKLFVQILGLQSSSLV